eukprot:4371999-Prymnesium_polylepis.1
MADKPDPLFTESPCGSLLGVDCAQQHHCVVTTRRLHHRPLTVPTHKCHASVPVISYYDAACENRSTSPVPGGWGNWPHPQQPVHADYAHIVHGVLLLWMHQAYFSGWHNEVSEPPSEALRPASGQQLPAEFVCRLVPTFDWSAKASDSPTGAYAVYNLRAWRLFADETCPDGILTRVGSTVVLRMVETVHD